VKLNINNRLLFFILLFGLLTSKNLVGIEINTLEGDIVEYYLKTLYSEISPINSGVYSYPEESDIKSFGELIELIKDGNEDNIPEAAVKAQEIGYEIFKFHQLENNNDYLILKENTTNNKKGWGTYIFNFNSENSVIIESPYPLNNINTGFISVLAFKKLNCSAVLISGAHRFSSPIKTGGVRISDVGLSQKSIFNTVHQSLVDNRKIIIQFLGYSKTRRKNKNIPPVILTNGDVNFIENKISLNNTEFLDILKRNLNNLTLDISGRWNELNACLFGENGVIEKSFSGNDNIQGQYIKNKLQLVENYFTLINMVKDIRSPKGFNPNDEKSYSDILKIIDSIEKSITDFKFGERKIAQETPAEIIKPVLPTAQSNELLTIEDIDSEPSLENEAEISEDIIPPAFDRKNLRKDIALLIVIFIGITALLLGGLIFLSIVVLRYRAEIKNTNKKITKLKSFNNTLENELRNIKQITDKIEKNYEDEKTEREKIEKNFFDEKKDKEHFYEGYNRLVSEKWELEKKLKKMEEEFEKEKISFEIEYIKSKEKGMPDTLSELHQIFDKLIEDNKTFKDNLRKNKLIRLMLDKNVKNKVTYILLSGELKLKHTLKRLFEIVSNQNDERVCVVAIWALGEIGEKDGVNILLNMLNSKNKNIYRYCKYALKKIGYTSEKEYFKENGTSDNNKDDIYKYSGFTSREKFIKYVLKEDDEDIRVLGLKILEKYGIENNLPLILNAIEDENTDVRYEAIRALENIEFSKDSTLLIDIDKMKKISEALYKILRNDTSIYVKRITAKTLEKIIK